MSPFQAREHRIPADLRRLREAREFADAAAREVGLAEDARYQVKLAVTEVVANAIQHGSSSARDPVRLLALEEAGALVVEVIDTGTFVPRVRRGGDLPERGRGLEFVRQLMDEVQVRPGREGTLVRFVKRVS